MLDTLAKFSKIDNIYIFDIETKLYIANNSEQLLDLPKYELCSEVVDIYVSMSSMNGTNEANEVNSTTTLKMNHETKNIKEILMMKILFGGLGLIYIINEEYNDRPYLIDQNIETFSQGLNSILSETISYLKKWQIPYEFII